MARIAYCTPGLGPCGGVRIIVEHPNRLAARGHTVGLFVPPGVSSAAPPWINVNAPIVPLADGGRRPAPEVTGQRPEVCRAEPGLGRDHADDRGCLRGEGMKRADFYSRNGAAWRTG